MDSKEHFAVAQIQPIVYEMIIFKFGYTYTLMEGLTLPRVFLPNSYTWKKTTDSLQKEIAKGSFRYGILNGTQSVRYDVR